jgi:amino acid adenylation domain-containing protein
MTNEIKDNPNKTTSLTSEKRKLLARRLGKLNLEQQNKQAIPRKTGRISAPLSLTQQRLWLIEQLEPERSINNVINILHLRGNLNQAALESALKKIVARHESLRTTFTEQDGEAIQHIAPYSEFRLITINLRRLRADQQQDEVKRIAQSEAQHSFDISCDILIRTVLLQLDQQEYVLIITLHHIVSDGWSTGILCRELEAFYRSALRNEPAELPDLPIQYADFAEWQRNWLQGETIAPLVDFWKKELLDAPRLELPVDRCHPKHPDYTTVMRSLQLSAELTEKIKQLGQKESCTLFMTLLACFNVLLHRYTSETDIVIGTPVAGRHGLDEIKDLIGFFINTVTLRTDLSNNPSFRQLLARVREMALAAYKNSSLPFDKLVEILRPDRREHRTPFFDVMINFHEASWHEFRLEGLDIKEWRLAEPFTDFALSLDILLENDCLHLNLKYQPAIFDEWRINRMLGHLKTLVEGCVANPDQSIAELPLLTEAEQRQILKEWNNTDREYPNDKTIHALFEQQVQATPDAMALMFENQHLTYHELNIRANQLAHLLIANGVMREQPIALLMDRSLELLISIIAIFKAGSAYLPLDPKHPSERLHTIIGDAAPKLLLTAGDHLESLADSLNVPVLKINAQQANLEAAPRHNPETPLSPNNLAYVLYTSGSTGIPKGVMIEHGSVINLAYALQAQAFDNVTKRPLRVALNTAITFDASVQQWIRLLWGDCIVMLPEEVSRDTQAFVAALKTQRADALGCTPTQLRLLLEEGLFNEAGNCPEIVLCGGEAIDTELWQQASAHQQSHFYNVYGPTECTVDSTCCLLDAKANIPHIGRPLANVRAYILDGNRQPVPVGISGELWLGGTGIGRGYLNKPDLTASSFFPDPYTASSDARLYKTGDLARYRPDGNIEYLGRIDFQVKLRGFRIELGEIESVLRQQPAVNDAVVTLREDVRGDQRLIAYVIAGRDAVPAHALTNILKTKLPEYMVPSDFIYLETFPLTSSGKIDRKSLPAPTHDRSHAADEFVAPSTCYEKQIARIWTEIMAVENPGLDDNFFELGGHSLLATRVVTRINHTFNIQLPLRNLFENPTVGALAQALIQIKARALPENTLIELVTQLENLPEADAEKRLAEKTIEETA